jgi:hypothetical protein
MAQEGLKLPPLPEPGPLFTPGALPEPPPLKRTEWFPLSISPVHCGKYEVGASMDNGYDIVLGDYLYDGREWADKLPPNANAWRGLCRGHWVNIRTANPARSGWYRMRYPKGEKSAPSYYVNADGDRLVGQAPGWYYAHPTSGEMLRYAMHPNWSAEWWHDGAPE